MTTPVPPISVQLLGKIDQFEAAMNKAGAIGVRNVSLIEQKFGALDTLAQRVAGTLGVSLSVAGLTQFYRSTVNGLDALNDLKDATGASIENISALEDIGARTGNTFEQVAATLVKFNKVLTDSRPGSDTAALIKAIGLNAEDLKRVDPAEALRRVAVALSGFADDGTKARVVQELFGKSVREAAPFLNDLASAGKLNATVTTQQAAEAEKFNHQLSQLAKNSTDTARSLLSDLVPAINQLLEKKNSQGFLALLGFDQEFDEKRKLAAFAAEVLAAKHQVDLLQEQLRGDPYNAESAERATRLAEQTARLERAKAAFRAIDPKARQDQAAAALAGSAGDYGNEGRNRPTPSIVLPDSQAFQRMRDQLQARAELARNELATGEPLREGDRLRIELMNQLKDATSGLSANEKARLTVMVNSTVAVVKLNDASKQSMERILAESRALAAENLSRQQANKALSEQIEEIGLTKDQLDALTISRLEQKAAIEEERIATLALFDAQNANLAQMRLNAEETRRNIQLRKDAIAKTGGQARDPLKGANDAIDAYLDKASKTGDATREAVASGLGNLESDLSSGLAKGKIDISNFVDTALTEFYRLQVVRPLLSSIFGGKSGNSLLSGIFGSSSDAGAASDAYALSSLFSLPGRASGGPVSSGSSYWVGENGPEVLRMGNQSGSITPNHALGGSSTNFDFSGQTINVGPGVSRGEVAAAVRQGNAETIALIKRSTRQGTFA